jgi:hypothetical protein
MINKTSRKLEGRATSVILGGKPTIDFATQHLPVLNIPSDKRLKYMKDLDFKPDKDLTNRRD